MNLILHEPCIKCGSQWNCLVNGALLELSNNIWLCCSPSSSLINGFPLSCREMWAWHSLELFSNQKNASNITIITWKSEAEVRGWGCVIFNPDNLRRRQNLPRCNCDSKSLFNTTNLHQRREALPPLCPIVHRGTLLVSQISNQWESQKNRLAFISIGKSSFEISCSWLGSVQLLSSERGCFFDKKSTMKLY